MKRHVAAGANWGRIVNVSTDGSPAFEGEVSYGSTKHALEALSRAAAKELGPFGITVNIVSPGPIQTCYITPTAEKHISASTPLRRVGQPADVADVIRFLCSEQARWLTGQMLFVGGGWRMVGRVVSSRSLAWIFPRGWVEGRSDVEAPAVSDSGSGV